MEFTKINATSAILIGGKSTRFKQDKAFIQLSTGNISEFIFNKLNPLFTEIFFVADRNDKMPFAGANIKMDRKANLGPIGGLFTALYYAGNDYCFLSACDMPFLSKTTIRILWDHRSDETDIIATIWNGNIEPMAAFYHKRCLPVIEKSIHNGQLMMKGFWDKVNVEHVDVTEYLPQDQIKKEFFNINTQDDYDTALNILDNFKNE